MRSHSLEPGRRSLRKGIGLMFVGTVFMLVNLGTLNSVLFRTWWPLLLIAVGALNIFLYFRRAHRRERPYTDFA